MSKRFLKVKIKSLAAEAYIIRREERRAKSECRWFRHKQGQEANLMQAESVFFSLKHHRTFDIRDESRSAQVAYGYIRGKSYPNVENATPFNPPTWNRVVDLVVKYGPNKDRNKVIDDLKNWSEYKKIESPVTEHLLSHSFK